jgi:hypothetical protein
LKVVDMEKNNMHSGNAGASSEEMPAWFMRWLNAQQPAFAMPSPPPSTQQPLAVAPTGPSTSVTTNNEGWQITTMPSDQLSFSTPDSLASPAMQETESPTTSTGTGVGMAAPPPISAPTDNLAALSGVLRNLLERPLPAPERPSFEGLRRQNPMKFLRAVEEYGHSFGLNSPRLLGVAVDCLKGNAKHWTGIYRDNWRTYEDFKRDFLKTYWSAQRQRDIRFQISTGRYDETKGTMLSHFAYFVDMAKMLTTPLSEEVLLDELIRHFPDNVQSLWILQKISNIAEAAEFLSGQEIPGQNPGFRDSASGDKGRATTQRHHTDQGQKRPRPNDSRFNVTGPPVPVSRDGEKRTPGNPGHPTSSNRFFSDKFQRRPGNNQWRNSHHQNGRPHGDASRGSKDSGNGGGVQNGA